MPDRDLKAIRDFKTGKNGKTDKDIKTDRAIKTDRDIKTDSNLDKKEEEEENTGAIYQPPTPPGDQLNEGVLLCSDLIRHSVEIVLKIVLIDLGFLTKCTVKCK